MTDLEGKHWGIVDKVGERRLSEQVGKGDGS